MEEDNKKKLINETVTGRRLTPKRAMRYALTAAICGIAFGTAAAASQEVIESVRSSFAADKTENDADAETENDAAETDETDASGAENASGEETGNGNEETSDSSESNSDVSENVTNIEQDEEELRNAVLNIQRQAAESVSRSLVAVTVTAQTNTWFDSEMESVDICSGIILSIDDREILILTPYIDADGKSVKVTFDNGGSADAYIKQGSMTDDLSVIAVSSVDGISSDTLESAEAIKYGDITDIRNGTAVIAVGSPLGVIDSCSFGNINYISHAEMGIDCSQQVYYSDVCSDAEDGTFIIDYSGKLIGVASADSLDVTDADGITRIVSISSLDRIIKLLTAGSRKAYLGVYGIDVDFGMKYSNIPEGVYVSDVVTGSPAYNAGIRHGDVITDIGDRNIMDVSSLSRALGSMKPGLTVNVTIMRGSVNSEYRELSCELVLGER